MAKIKKTAKPKVPLKKTSLPELQQRLGNKIESVRQTAKPRAARAAERYGAPAGVALIVLLTLLSLSLPQSQFQKIKTSLIRHPRDFQAHLFLAEEYLQNNQLEEAEKELLLAEQLQVSTSKNNILGIEAPSLEKLWQQKRESNPAEIRLLIKAWEEIISQKPDYRDGFFQLGLLYYRLGETEKAQENLQATIELDPNFEPAKELIKELESR